MTEHKADAGVMISASHNSVEYNGIKLFSGTGFKLPDSVEEEIEELILDKPVQIQLKNGCDIGRVSVISTAAEEYIEHLKSTADCSFDELTVAVDCANGSASVTAEKLFTDLGAKCIMLSDTPDGCNINDNCGSTHLENLRDFVMENKCDLGIAFDGDADRCLAVDDSGDVIDGDKLIAIIADYMREKETLKKDTAVVTVMSNLGFHTYMKEKGINTVCTAVGDRYVLEEMLKNGYNIGCEQSGHIIFLDHATTGDGQLTAVQLMNLLVMRRKSLYRLTMAIHDYPQLLDNVVISEDKKGKWDKIPAITDIIERAKESMGDKGRILVRESGTEPLVRVMVEGIDDQAVQYWTNQISDTIDRELGIELPE